MTRETTPLWFGIKDASANIGKTKNRGMELELGWHDKIGENVNYYIKANMALNQNRIVYKDDPNKRPEYQKAAGKPIGWQKAHHVWSNYQSLDDVFNYAIPENITQQGKILPGDFMYIDYNADGVIDSKDQMPLDRVQYPSQTYGISFGGSYKNFSLNVTFYGASGMTRNMPQLVYWDFLNAPNGIYLSTPEVGERWQPGMQGVVRPTFHSTNVAGYNRKASTYSYKDYGYLRLKNLELAYSITPKFLDFIGCRKIQFYMNGNNLFTITSLSKYIDPETSGAGVYPMVRRYNIGFRIDL